MKICDDVCFLYRRLSPTARAVAVTQCDYFSGDRVSHNKFGLVVFQVSGYCLAMIVAEMDRKVEVVGNVVGKIGLIRQQVYF